jgi:hypothetical protein
MAASGRVGSKRGADAAEAPALAETPGLGATAGGGAGGEEQAASNRTSVESVRRMTPGA